MYVPRFGEQPAGRKDHRHTDKVKEQVTADLNQIKAPAHNDRRQYRHDERDKQRRSRHVGIIDDALEGFAVEHETAERNTKPVANTLDAGPERGERPICDDRLVRHLRRKNGRIAVLVENVKDVDGVARRRHLHVRWVEDKGVSLLAAHTTVAAYEFLQRRHRTVFVQRADQPEIAGVGKVHDAPQLPDTHVNAGLAHTFGSRVWRHGVVAHDFTRVEVAAPAFAQAQRPTCHPHSRAPCRCPHVAPAHRPCLDRPPPIR